MEDNENCTSSECSTHNRVDLVYVRDDVEYARLVTYLGEWCIVTGDNPKFDPVTVSEATTIEELIEEIAEYDAPDMYETAVIKVGDGAMGDLPDSIDGSYDDFTFYVETHDDWEGVRDTHELIVTEVQVGMLDLGRSLMEQEIDAMAEWK